MPQRVDIVAKAFERGTGVENIDVAFVAEALLLEHRARRQRIVVHAPIASRAARGKRFT